jgi:hypothetical protein
LANCFTEKKIKNNKTLIIFSTICPNQNKNNHVPPPPTPTPTQKCFKHFNYVLFKINGKTNQNHVPRQLKKSQKFK